MEKRNLQTYIKESENTLNNSKRTYTEENTAYKRYCHCATELYALLFLCVGCVCVFITDYIYNFNNNANYAPHPATPLFILRYYVSSLSTML